MPEPPEFPGAAVEEEEEGSEVDEGSWKPSLSCTIFFGSANPNRMSYRSNPVQAAPIILGLRPREYGLASLARSLAALTLRNPFSFFNSSTS